jgi:DNA-binding LacI/PurR family transcriptional regulator
VVFSGENLQKLAGDPLPDPEPPSARPQTVALIVVRATLLAYPELLPELLVRLERQGLAAMIFQLEREGDVDAVLARLPRYAPAAAVAAARPSAEAIAALQRQGIPVVLYNCFNRGTVAPTVSCDHAQCGRTVASLLMDGGHWRFGIIGSPTDSLVGAERLAGVLEVLQARRARSIEVVEGDYTHDSGGPALDRLFALMKPRPSAVIAANDAMAIGAIDRAVELGIRVPRDLSVVGFDGTQAANWPSHQLTTMRQPLATMADAAVDLLCRVLRNPQIAAEARLFAAELVPGRTARFTPRRRHTPGSAVGP